MAVIDLMKFEKYRSLLKNMKIKYWRVGMNTLINEIHDTKVLTVELTDDELIVGLNDGRTIAVPIAWYPRLLHATQEERNHWRLIGDGNGIHWEDLDEDISVQHLLAGIASGESQKSLRRWLAARS